MLDTSIENLRLEINQAELDRKRMTAKVEELIAGYTGSFYREGVGPEIESHENHAFDLMVNTLPAMSFYNPKVYIKSRRPRVHREIAQSSKHGMNRWISDVNLSEILDEIALDMLIGYGVALVTLEPLPGYEADDIPPLRPRVSRISPYRFIQDPQALSERETRYKGHRWTRDKEDLMRATRLNPRTGRKEAVFNRELLRSLTEDTSGGLGQRDRNLFNTSQPQTQIPRSQVSGYELFVPEDGMIYTMAQEAASDKFGWLRPPRKAFGPPWGPYILFGLYWVPESPWPLSPLNVSAALADELNAHLDQISEQADSARQVTIMQGGEQDAGVQTVKNARNGDVISVPGFDASMIQVITVGGPSVEQMAYADRLRARIDRKTGMPEFIRGNVAGATATENTLAQGASDKRSKFMQLRFRRKVKKLLETALWYMTESENVVFPVPITEDQPDNPEFAEFSAGGKNEKDGLFIGGHQPGQDFNFFDLELEIEPMSMEYVDQSVLQRRADEVFAWLTQSSQLMVQTPWLNWPLLAEKYFESRNIPDGRRFINWAMVQRMIGLQQFEGSEPSAAPGTEGTPGPKPINLAAGSGTEGRSAPEEPANPAASIGASAGANALGSVS